MEWFLVLVALLLVVLMIVAPIMAIVLVVVALRRLREVQRRLQALEAAAEPAPPPAPPPSPRPVVMPKLAPMPRPAAASAATPSVSSGIDWEQLIGRRALSWVALVLLVFAAAFFLRHAYENDWVGPLGQVAVGILTGLALIGAGWRYHLRGWQRFSRVLTGAGVVVLLLSVYSSYAFYRLLPELVASGFMLAVIVLSALVAALYRSPALAWVSMLGGLATPLLMASEVDRYPALFTYLVLLNVGVVLLGRLRGWPGLGSVALLATHALFWLWHSGWYHPEKLAWALGFHLVIFLLYLALDFTRGVGGARRATAEGLARLVVNAGLGFGAAYALLSVEHRWSLGLLALALAALYVAVARWALAGPAPDPRRQLMALAVALGFVAVAIPLEAQARWVAFGWAATAAAVWWFGLRVREAALRAIAGGLFTLAVGRLVLFDILQSGWLHQWPLLNLEALPALGVVGCLLGALALTDRWRAALGRFELGLASLATVASLLLLLLVLVVDVRGALAFRALADPEQGASWLWRMQLAVSVLAALYATALLTLGFMRRRALLRWTALLIFAWTIGKVLLVDMAGLEELYRILAFLIVAILLGLSGWAYQRLQVSRRPGPGPAGGAAGEGG